MDWPRYARALDRHLQGWQLQAIGAELGVSKERARQIVVIAKHQLAYRVFKGVPRRVWRWDRERGRWMTEALTKT